ncbi:SusC/RagA family TonB-linked outer membrane protein [Dawidia soli]|uniref:SusC/RagA family TonB-linked outer membrane protein n=1 Tax=Dawidia soli TaxID=2782352 RepID=A0AAP2GKJ8_9BACT|nr:SusC/RagA family TonB-linked outer membrane protein [Dawidia soli]MBT1689123.1 SusC/RagA family TonB-linked outer membrane protein [Dawidia soli]
MMNLLRTLPDCCQVKKRAVVMRLTAILLMGMLSETYATVYSQDVRRIDLHVKEKNFRDVLKEIRSKTNLKFIYKSDWVSEREPMSLDLDSSTITEVLDKLSAPYALDYEVHGTTVIFKKSRRVLTAEPVNIAPARVQQQVTGKIVDESGGALPGASVLIKGSSQGTAADADGNFTLRVNPADVLVFSFVGFESQEITVGTQSVINVTLKGFTSLEEVVVTGYGDVSKRSYTGASQSIEMEDIHVKGVGDVSQMLQGRAAGVSIQNVSGTFGAGPKITIRGASSITGDGKPLWVIDGVVQEDLVNLSLADLVSGNTSTLIGSSVAGLNPNDIESFEILKDASATALYGSRSLNGVIVIKTKRGRRSAPLAVSYAGEFTTRSIPTYDNTDILNSKDNFSVLKELENKGRLDITTISQSRYSGVYGIMANRINTYDAQAGAFLLANTPQARNQFLQTYERANTDWFNTVFKSSVTQNHTIGLSGGGQNNQFYSSIGLYKDPGWTVADKVDRLSVNLRNTFFLQRDAQLTISMLGSYRQQLAPGSFNRSSDDVFGSLTRDFDINPYSYALNTSRTLRPYGDNGELEYYTFNWAPFNILNETDNNYTDVRVQDIKLQTDFQIPLFHNKVQYAFVGAVRYANSVSEHQISENSNVAGAYRADENTVIRDANIFLWNDPDNPTRPPVVVLPEGGLYFRTDNFLRNYYIRNSLTFKETFNTRHEFDAFIGQEVRFVDREETAFEGYGLNYSGGLIPNTDPRIISKVLGETGSYFSLGSPRNPGERAGTTSERTASFFSRLTYGLDGKYFFSFTGNLNASNTQGLRNGKIRWTPTYTFGGKWNIREEGFMQNAGWLTTMNLRASYGLTAIAGTATNTLAVFRSTITQGRRSVDDRESSITIEDLRNNDLTYEKQYETNIGLDMGIINNRINITADVYRRKGFDLFDYVRTAGLGGQDIKLINNANMTTRGIEVSIRTKNIDAGDFHWTSTVNLSAFKQKVTKIESKPTLLDAVDDTGASFIGYPRNSLFSIQFTGLNDKGLPVYNIPDKDKTFDVDFQDTGSSLTTPEGQARGLLSYLKYEGPTDANKAISLQNTFQYKNWSLGFFITASGGNKVRLPVMYGPNSFTDLTMYSKSFVNRWILPGDERYTAVPVIPDSRLIQENEENDIKRAYNAYNFSTQRVADGSYVRLRTVNVAYTVPKAVLSRFYVKSMTISGLVQNPWLIYADDKLNGVDPEFYSSGGVAQPITRQYTLSLNLGF